MAHTFYLCHRFDVAQHAEKPPFGIYSTQSKIVGGVIIGSDPVIKMAKFFPHVFVRDS